jgi:hypothetical protein
MPALKVELRGLLESLRLTDDVFNSSITQAAGMLRVESVKSYLDGIAIGGSKEMVDIVLGELRQTLDKFRVGVVTCRDSLFHQSASFSVVKISDNTLEFSALNKHRKALLDGLPEDEAQLTDMRSEKKDLDRAIREYQSSTFIDRLMPIVQELQDSLGEGGGGGESSTHVVKEKSADEKKDEKSVPDSQGFVIPEMAKKIVRVGVSIASKVLSIVNDKIKYGDLLEARNKLKNKIESLQGSMSDAQKKVDVVDDKLEQLMILGEVVEPRVGYLKEASQITDSFTVFINLVFPYGKDLNKKDDLIEVGKQWVEKCPGFNKYLTDVQFNWLRT